MRRYAWLVLGAVVSAHGWGNGWYYLVAWGFLWALMVTEPLVSPVTRGVLLLVAVAALLEPSLTLSSSLLAVALLLVGQHWLASGILLARVPLLLAPWVDLPAFLCHPMTALTLYVALWAGCLWARPSPRWGGIIPCIYALLLIAWTGSTYELNPVSDRETAPGYRIGPSIARLTHRDFPPTGVLCYEQHPADTRQARGSVYLDHGAASPYAESTFVQHRPWGAQTPIAAEPLAMAIKRDGVWICNIGTTLVPGTCRYLGGLMQDGHLHTLLGSNRGQLISGDSDFAVDCLAPYQKHLIRHLTGTDTPYRIHTLLSASLLLLLPALTSGVPRDPTEAPVPSREHARNQPSRWGRVRPWSKHLAPCLPLLLPAVAYLLPAWLPENGDVRCIGTHHAWPHTELGEGLVRHLQQHGIPAVFGTRGARILVVGQGHHALWHGESVIVLEPGAQVLIGEVSYRAGTIPLGTRSGIPDARDIHPRRYPNTATEPTAGILHTPSGVRLIATGSPCRLSTQHLWPEPSAH